MHIGTTVGLFIACARPGLIRGGVPHPAGKMHKVDAFTEAQLQEMLAEPAISIVYGRQVTSEDIGDMLRMTMPDRTHVVGSRVETDAGASATTEALGQHNEKVRELVHNTGAIEQEVANVERDAAGNPIAAAAATIQTAAKPPIRRTR